MEKHNLGKYHEFQVRGYSKMPRISAFEQRGLAQLESSDRNVIYKDGPLATITDIQNIFCRVQDDLGRILK